MRVGTIGEKPDVYELVSKLKVTRTKARRLIYEHELRTRTKEELEQEVRSLLRQPIIQKRGELFALDVQNPLVCDHIRAMLRELNCLADGSFSPNIITLSLDAMTALIHV